MKIERIVRPSLTKETRPRARRVGPEPPEIIAPGDRPSRSGPAARPDRTPIPIPTLVAGACLLSFLLAGFFLLGDRGFWELRRQRTRLASLQAEVSSLAAENGRMEVEIQRLRTDPTASERLAREELNFVRPGEVVLVLPKGWTRKATEREGARLAGKALQHEPGSEP